MLEIDNEFRDLITPLTPEELSGLEASILKDGCLDPIKIWGRLIVDGHNRYAICEKHGLDFDTKEMLFQTRQDALNWIIDNQLGRRNLAPWQQSILRGKRYNAEKKDKTENLAQNLPMYQNDTSGISTREKLASQFGVSQATISRDADFAKAAKMVAERTSIPVMQLTKAQIIEAAKEIQETKQAMAITTYSHNSLEYYTPSWVIEAVREVMGRIDLDPASCEEAQATVKAKTYYKQAEDGLSKVWTGKVWLNPPYSKTNGKSNQEIWAQRLIQEYQDGNVTEAVLLVKAAFGYKWFEELFDTLPVCFLKQRLSFTLDDGSDEGQSKQGTAIFYIGDNFGKFYATFRRYGRIIPAAHKLDTMLEQQQR